MRAPKTSSRHLVPNFFGTTSSRTSSDLVRPRPAYTFGTGGEPRPGTPVHKGRGPDGRGWTGPGHWTLT